MRKKLQWLGLVLMATCIQHTSAQSIHFSQYYNAPLQVNPANTALMSDDDIRVGANYRNQWSALPVPFNTFSGWTDFKIKGRGSDRGDRTNWLGIGGAFYSDKAGDGNLSLSQIQGNLAYHLQLSSNTMVSAGGSAAYVQRSVNYDNLTFDAQWDGFAFNNHMPNGEKVGVIKTNYTTVAAGLNFAWFPNEFAYIKLGVSLSNINQPIETFYNNGKNQVAMRPAGFLDGVFRTTNVLTINPSIYATQQNGAFQLVGGSLFRVALNDKNDEPMQLILGLFDRIGDAFIGVAGVEFQSIQLMGSYDMTQSTLAPYNGSYGALEFSLIYHRPYHRGDNARSMLSCPRFF
jgi:type IX secretion system PorP/SprF family membrane protein